MTCPSCRRLVVAICSTRIAEREAIVRTLQLVFDSTKVAPKNAHEQAADTIVTNTIRQVIKIIQDERIRV